MKTTASRKALYQILDANVNRAREGIRVAEEIFRYVRKDKKMTASLKDLRHQIEQVISHSALPAKVLEACRDSSQDLGRSLRAGREMRRENFGDILVANMHRVGEALRVLEEFFKLFDTSASRRFKQLRFRFYDIERDACARL